MEVIVVYINFPSKESACQIGTTLIKEQLAACVNIIPSVESIYQWKGELCREEEVMVMVKTTTHSYQKLEARVSELHPYEVPEIIVQKLVRGSDKYLKWVQGQLE